MSISIDQAMIARDRLLNDCERILAHLEDIDEKRSSMSSGRATEMPALAAERRRWIATVTEKLAELNRRDDYIDVYLDERRSIAARAARHPYRDHYRAWFGPNWPDVVIRHRGPGWRQL